MSILCEFNYIRWITLSYLSKPKILQAIYYLWSSTHNHCISGMSDRYYRWPFICCVWSAPY
jgi:hypothetical protein